MVAATAACSTKGQPGDSASGRRAAAGEVAGDSAKGRPASGARTAAQPVSKGDEPLPDSELPKRSRRDSVALASMTKPDSNLDKLWPVKMPAPLPGALLPNKRIVAFYGNPLSKKMGVLGEYPKDEMLAKLD